VTQQISYRIGSNLYLSITDRCTLACAFCPKTQGLRMVHGYDLSFDHRPEVTEILASIDDPTRYHEVVFCGFGEPTLRLGVLLEVARQIKARGGRVRVNTDGLSDLVHKRPTLPELGSCVDALSVSMNAQDQPTYEHHCQPRLAGSYAAMLRFLAQASQFVPEVTASAIDGLPGVDIAACEHLARQLGVRFRRRVLNQVG
jgi:TatD family-associated radical SAM protein